MKNLINYYYGIIVTDYKRQSQKYVFKLNGYEYIFMEYVGNIDFLNHIWFELKKNNKYCHEIVLNNNNQITTYYNNKSYILLKKNISVDNKINLQEIISFSTKTHNNGKIKWKEMWEEKIDYYEYQMSEFGFKYEELKKTFNYYIGLSETAISLLNYLSANDFEYYFQHRRINLEEELNDFLNPINIIEDTYVRDFAEYIKMHYINDKLDLNSSLNIISSLELNYDTAILFLARMLYPNYYFDCYDQIIKGENSFKEIDYYTKKSAYYETLLNEIYKLLFFKYRLPRIEWLEFNQH